MHGLSLVMPGLVPGTHVFRATSKTWMAGTSPAMTQWGYSMPTKAALASPERGFRPNSAKISTLK